MKFYAHQLFMFAALFAYSTDSRAISFEQMSTRIARLQGSTIALNHEAYFGAGKTFLGISLGKKNWHLNNKNLPEDCYLSSAKPVSFERGHPFRVIKTRLVSGEVEGSETSSPRRESGYYAVIFELRDDHGGERAFSCTSMRNDGGLSLLLRKTQKVFAGI